MFRHNTRFALFISGILSLTLVLIGCGADPNPAKSSDQIEDTAAALHNYKHGGLVTVQTNLDAACWKVYNTLGHRVARGCGMNTTFGLPANDPTSQYRLTFVLVDGYSLPYDQSFTVVAGQTTALAAEYDPLPPTMATVVVRSNLAAACVDLVSADGNTALGGCGDLNMFQVPASPNGSPYNFFYTGIDGYVSPPDETLSLVPGTLTVLERDYTAIPPPATATLTVNTSISNACYDIMDSAGQYVGGGCGALSRTFTLPASVDPGTDYQITAYAVWQYDPPSVTPVSLITDTPATVTLNYTPTAPNTALLLMTMNLTDACYTVYDSVGRWAGSGCGMDSASNLQFPAVSTSENFYVDFQNVWNYQAPQGFWFTASPGDSLSFSATYLPDPPTTALVTAVSNLTQGCFRALDMNGVLMFNGCGLSTLFSLADDASDTVGTSYIITWWGVNGYQAPQDTTLVVTAGTPAYAWGIYTPL